MLDALLVDPALGSAAGRLRVGRDDEQPACALHRVTPAAHVAAGDVRDQDGDRDHHQASDDQAEGQPMRVAMQGF